MCGDYKECFYDMKNWSQYKVKFKKKKESRIQICIHSVNPTKWTFTCFISINCCTIYYIKINIDSPHSGWWDYEWFKKQFSVYFSFFLHWACIIFLSDLPQSQKSQLRPKEQLCWMASRATNGCPSVWRLPLTALAWGSWFLWAAGKYVWSTCSMGVCGREEKSKREVWQSDFLGRDQSSLCLWLKAVLSHLE